MQNVGLVLAAAALCGTGCSTAIRWQGPTYPEALATARAQKRLTFVYFRNWYSVECTDFEESVLKHPDVLAETRAMICVVLDFEWDRPLANQWHLSSAPAYALVAPDGEVLARGVRPTRDELLMAMRGARAKARTPAPAPQWLPARLP